MRWLAFAIFDKKAGAYNRPFFAPTEGLAVRSMQDEVNRADVANAMHMHPSDFELFHVGAFEDGSGVFEPLQNPKLLIRADQLMQK